MNYPIFDNHWGMNLSQILDYLRKFNKHKAIINTRHDVFKNKRELSTHHKYSDGLSIVVQWEIDSSLSVYKISSSIDELFSFYDNHLIVPINFNFFSFSSKPELVDDNARYHFFKIIGKRRKNLTLSQYQELEFSDKIVFTIPEERFLELENFISNLILFEKFMKDKNKEGD